MVFPEGFLWGAATAAHQVEGNNIASDLWALEHAPESLFAEPSGDACDHYRLFRQDIALLAELGFNAYRFSIEWARVEPEDGWFSPAALAHYREVLQACQEFGLTPMVTLHHFTSPHWLMRLGGWEYAGTPDRFAAYCREVMSELGSLIPYVCTINEANIAATVRSILGDVSSGEHKAPVGVHLGTDTWRQGAARALGTVPDKLNPFLLTFSDTAIAMAKRAHLQARRAIAEVSPSTKAGLTLALSDLQPVAGGQERADQLWGELFEAFLPWLDGDDFLGVQTYSRAMVGPDGLLPNPEHAERTLMGYEHYPQALEAVLRRATEAGLPLYVTENGIATREDSRRVDYIDTALRGVQRCLADGIDVRGYFYWSALDNFEWMFGYEPTFGLIGVDRRTQQRTTKNSAHYLGGIATRNALP